MKLLGRELITIQPKKQTLTASTGRFVIANDGASWTEHASVQPIGQAVLERLAEGARKSARWIVYLEGTQEIDIGGAGAGPCDYLTTSKGTLLAIEQIDYLSHKTGLPHTAYACAQVGGDE